MDLLKVKEEVTLTEEMQDDVLKLGDELVNIKNEELVRKLCSDEIDIKEELEENPDESITEAVKDTKNEIYKYSCKKEEAEVSNGIGLTSVHAARAQKSSCFKHFECNVCNYKSVFKGYLIRHMRDHTGEKPYACHVCNYKSVVERNLVGHILRHHTNKKSFECNKCNFKGVDKQNLIIHKRIHKLDKPFKCKICNYESVAKRNLVRHMHNHTDETLFECNICNYQTVYKGYLVRHMRNHTGYKSCE